MEKINQFQPKEIYLDIAKNVAESIGEFNGLHLRLADFRNWDTPGYTAPKSDEEYSAALQQSLDSNFDNQKTLVVSTDESSNKSVFDPVRQNFTNLIFVDDLICNDFADRFRSLPFRDETTLAFLCQLVLCHADDFIGTMRSTFSAFIHRSLAQRNSTMNGVVAPFKYVYSGIEDDSVIFENGKFLERASGPFSWNRIRLPVHTGTLSWAREWPECVVTQSRWSKTLKDLSARIRW